jgi:ribosome maturation factor RimP
VAGATLFGFREPIVPAKNIILEKVEELSAPILSERGAELVDLQFVHEHGQWVLRYFVDKPAGITLDDCATISNDLSQILDTTDVISQSYSLEVSSPGIYRPLKKESDFQRFIGECADVTLYAPVEGRRHFRGTIEAVAQGAVTIRDHDDKSFALPVADIAKAKLDPEIKI